jgi:glutaryl-CoA dehydrogenase
VANGLIMQELERGDSGLRSFVSVQGSLCMWPIYAYGTEAQKQTWLPPMARARRSAASGSPSRTTARTPGHDHARREEGGPLDPERREGLDHQRSVADVAVVWAQTADGIRGFLVEKGTPGYTTRTTRASSPCAPPSPRS